MGERTRNSGSGYFWSRDKNNVKIPGVLSVSDQNEVSLELTGWAEDVECINEGAKHESIFGIVNVQGKDKYVVLNDCLLSKWTAQTIPQRILTSTRLNVGEAFFCQSKGILDGLNLSEFWFTFNGINEYFGLNSRSTQCGSRESYFRGNDLNIRLNVSHRSSEGFYSSRIDVRGFIVLERNPPAEYSLIGDDFLKIRNLLSFCMGSGVLPTGTYGVTDTKDSVAIHTNYLKPRKGMGKFKFKSVLISPSDQDVDFAGITTNWLGFYSDEDARLAIESYSASKYYSQGYIENNFSLLAHSLEPLFRWVTKKCTLQAPSGEPTKRKVKNRGRGLAGKADLLLGEFPDVFGSDEERRVICESVSNTRHYLAHFAPQIAGRAKSGSETFLLAVQLECLHELWFARLLGIPDKPMGVVIDKIKCRLEHFQETSIRQN